MSSAEIFTQCAKHRKLLGVPRTEENVAKRNMCHIMSWCNIKMTPVIFITNRTIPYNIREM